jgi:hypothetical protein
MRISRICHLAVIPLGLTIGYLLFQRGQVSPHTERLPPVAVEMDAPTEIVAPKLVQTISSKSNEEQKPKATISTGTETATEVDPSLQSPQDADPPVERAIMATTWGLSDEQTRQFEIASDAPRQERADVFKRFTRGEIAREDLGKEMDAAEERGNQRLRGVLGEAKFLEYQTMRGHFVTAGLEYTDFEAPVRDTTASAESSTEPTH